MFCQFLIIKTKLTLQYKYEISGAILNITRYKLV